MCKEQKELKFSYFICIKRFVCISIQASQIVMVHTQDTSINEQYKLKDRQNVLISAPLFVGFEQKPETNEIFCSSLLSSNLNRRNRRKILEYLISVTLRDTSIKKPEWTHTVPTMKHKKRFKENHLIHYYIQ